MEGGCATTTGAGVGFGVTATGVLSLLVASSMATTLTTATAAPIATRAPVLRPAAPVVTPPAATPEPLAAACCATNALQASIDTEIDWPLSKVALQAPPFTANVAVPVVDKVLPLGRVSPILSVCRPWPLGSVAVTTPVALVMVF